MAKVFGVIFAVLATLAGVAWAARDFWMPHVHAWRWDGSSTFVCEGNHGLRMKAKVARVTGGPAIELRDNCSLTCTGCELTGEVAVRATGNAKVVLEGGSATGTDAAIELRSNGRLEASNASLSGPVGVVGTEGNARIRLTDVTLKATGLAADLGGNAELEARDSTLEAPDGVRAAGNARVTLRGGGLTAKNRALELRGNARAEAKQAKVEGGVVEDRVGSFKRD